MATSGFKSIAIIVLKGNTVEVNAKDAEIIQISVVLEHDQFHSCVKPKLKSELDEECKEAHRVHQFSIDSADSWPQVETKLEKWLLDRGINPQNEEFIIAADGHSGFEHLLTSQSRITDTRIPSWAHPWIDIRTEFRKSHQTEHPINELDLVKMAEIGSVRLDGTRRGHGRDEAFDLACVVLSLLRKEHTFEHVQRISDISPPIDR